MNKEHFEDVLARIAQPGYRLSQRSYFADSDPEGKIACVAGHAAMLAGWERVVTNDSYDGRFTVTRGEITRSIYSVAREYLGLTSAEARRLFFDIHAQDAHDIARTAASFEENLSVQA
jgi:hypothetical protein